MSYRLVSSTAMTRFKPAIAAARLGGLPVPKISSRLPAISSIMSISSASTASSNCVSTQLILHGTATRSTPRPSMNRFGMARIKTSGSQVRFKSDSPRIVMRHQKKAGAKKTKKYKLKNHKGAVARYSPSSYYDYSKLSLPSFSHSHTFTQTVVVSDG